jgi:phenylacetate-coenzyme A ligase PaaK-like adenylate-forming protein
MAPSLPHISIAHRMRKAHPLRNAMRSGLERLEHADSAEIKRSQERRLRALVRVAAARSSFYREYFREAGVDPQCIRTLEDLPQLPVLTRDHLLERADDFRVYPRWSMWTAHSSGTSGRPIGVYRTPGSSVYELCALERQWGWFGLRPGARRVILRGSDFAIAEPGKLTKAVPGARELLVSSFHLIPSNVDAIMHDVRAFAPDAIEGWPSSIALLAALLRERDEKFPVKAVITSSENLTAGRIALIEDVFSGPVVDHYGQTERVMLAGACEQGGFHTFPDYGIVELLPVPNTESRWELVGTPLHNWGFPLFRYRTGDQVGPAPTQPCPCGRSFPLLGPVDGRVEDSFTAPDGRPIPLPGTVVDDLSGVREAQIAELARGRYEVRVVPAAGFDESAVEETVCRNVEHIIGPGQDVTVRVMPRIPRSQTGKLKSAVVEGKG